MPRTLDIFKTNNKLEKLSAKDRIKWAFSEFGQDIVLTTSGGETSALLLHLVSQSIDFKPPVVFIDTGFYPKSTINILEHYKNLGFEVKIFKSSIGPEEIKRRYPGWRRARSKHFDEVLTKIKHDPLNRAFAQLKPKMWIRGVRKYETVLRRNYKILRLRNGLYQFNPILDWSRERVGSYINCHCLPRNRNHFDITKGVSQKMDCYIGERCGLF